MGYELHAVIISKDIPLEEAKKMAKHFIKGNKKYFRETKNTYRFRNIPKNQFEKSSFRTKKINKNISLIYGNHLTLSGSGFFDDIKQKLGDFLLKYNPLSMMVRSTLENVKEDRARR